MKRIATLMLMLLLTAPVLWGQRVGVVFSGGGSKGLYHIGILKALEENRIPVDYVAGTSMGAIIAGLYAVGYTPAEMEQLFVSDQVKLWMSGQIEREYSYYFNRMKPRQELISLPLDFKAQKNIAVLPTNLVPSTQIDMAFDQMFAASTAASGGDFDELLVPFRCVASDIYGKKEVVFREGDIGEAIRSSMAIPLVFKPMRVDSVLYFDGGIFNNFPWQALQEEFAPDVYIGGKCIREIPDPDEGSLVDLVEALTMTRTDFDLPEGRSVLIDHVFDDVNVIDFSRARYIIETGYADAMAQMDSIKQLISRRQDPDQLHDRRLKFRASLPELVFDDYRVEGLHPDQVHYVRRMLGLDEEEYRTFSFNEFKSAYFKMLSDGELIGDFPRMTYRDSTGYFTVQLPLRTRPSLRVKIGGNISSTQLQQAYFGLEYKTIAKRAHSLYFDSNFSGMYTSLRGGWRTDFYLGMPVYFELEFNTNKYTYRKGPNWSTFEEFGYLGYRDTYATTSLGIPLGRNSALQGRFNYGTNRYKYYEREYVLRETGTEDRTKFSFYGVQLEISSRTLNYPMFPTRGIAQEISALFVNGKEHFTPGENYVPLDGDGNEIQRESASSEPVVPGENPFTEPAARRWIGARYTREEYIPMWKWFTMGYLIDAVFTTRPDFYTQHASNFASPGFAPTQYSRSLYMNNFRSPYYLGAGVMPTLEFSDNFYLKSGLYLYVSDKLMERGLRQTDKIRHIFETSLVYQSPIGPASLTVTNYEEASRKWFIVFNLGFTLFNNRGLFY